MLGLLVVRRVAGVATDVGLIDDLAVRVAEDGDGRDVHDTPYPELAAEIQHALGPAHIRLEHRAAAFTPDADLVHRGAVDDRGDAAETRAQRDAVGEVPPDDRRTRKSAGAGRIAHQRHDLITALEEPARHGTGDETGRPGDQDP